MSVGICEACGGPTKRGYRRFCSHRCSVRSRPPKHGMSFSPTYITYRGMLARCLNPKATGYARYGGRGITIDPRWIGAGGFERFLADMGERPEGMTLDRRDNDGPYRKANCRWATSIEQSRTRSNTKLEAHEPDQIRWLVSCGYTAREVARFFGVSDSNVNLIAPVRKTRGGWQHRRTA